MILPFGGLHHLLWRLLTCLHPSPTVPSLVVRFARTAADISQGKPCLFPLALAGFTSTTSWVTFGPHCIVPACPVASAFYPIPVRRVQGLPYASFGFRLATDTLASPSGSCHLGPQRTLTSQKHGMPGTHRVGGGLTAPVLPHHRAYGSVHGGFLYGCNAAYLPDRLMRPWFLNQALLIAW